jgi:hypothetical protein
LLYGGGEDFVQRSESRSLLSASGAETFATQYGPSGRRFKRNSVALATLVAGDFKPLALPATSATASAATAAAEIGAARITTLLASFRLAQIPFLIVVLLAFCKGKSVSAFRAGDINVRHDRFLHVKALARLSSLSCANGSTLVLPCFLRLRCPSISRMKENYSRPRPTKVQTPVDNGSHPDTSVERLEVYPNACASVQN